MLRYKSGLDGKGGNDFYPRIVVMEPSEKPVDPQVNPMLGDVDGDNEVTILDATYIQRHLASIPLHFEFSDKAADTDGDGFVSIIDATYIQRWLAGLSSNDNIGKSISDASKLDNEDEEFPYLVNKPVCPSCGSDDVAYIIYGYPMPEESYSEAFREKLNNHEITFGGCVIEPDCPNWYCNTCNNSFKN